MPLVDADLARRRSSIKLPPDQVDFVLYSFNKQSFDEQHFTSVDQLLSRFNSKIEDDVSPVQANDCTCHWIEVINNGSDNFPPSMELLCKHFELHFLTMEDISTLAQTIKLDLFNNNGTIYLLMKVIDWNGVRVEQQQISFYLRSSQNLLITFQEKSTDNLLFETIRQRLRRQKQQQQQQDDVKSQHHHNRLRTLNVDYLFYCLVDAIIDRYMLVLDNMSTRIGQIDEKLMADSRSRTLSTLHLIYHIKHDLLHLRILFNPLSEIIFRLQRTLIGDQQMLPKRHVESILRLGLTHHILRRQTRKIRRDPSNSSIQSQTSHFNTETTTSSLFLHKYLYVYLNDLSGHVKQLIDTLEMHRESVASLVSFLLTLNDNETQQTLKLLMLITAIFMPCMVLLGINSTNFHVQPPLEFKYGYYILLSLLATIAISMITWYKIKRWI